IRNFMVYINIFNLTGERFNRGIRVGSLKEGTNLGIGYGNSWFPTDEFPVSAKQFPCSVLNRESTATYRNCTLNGCHVRTESAERTGHVRNSLLFSLFSGNLRAVEWAER